MKTIWQMSKIVPCMWVISGNRDENAWIFYISFKPGLSNLLQILKVEFSCENFITTKLCILKRFLSYRVTVRVKAHNQKTHKKIIKVQKWTVSVAYGGDWSHRWLFPYSPNGGTWFILEKNFIK